LKTKLGKALIVSSPILIQQIVALDCRRTILPKGPLTLESADASIWDNKTGFSTQLIVDFQMIFACLRISQSDGNADQPLTNDLRKVFKMLRGSQSLSTRVTLAIRSSNEFRTGLKHTFVCLMLMLTHVTVTFVHSFC
jgi:hypothetical protein